MNNIAEKITRELGFRREDICTANVKNDAEYYIINFSDGLSEYEVYADRDDLRIVGLDSRPGSDDTFAAAFCYGRYCA